MSYLVKISPRVRDNALWMGILTKIDTDRAVVDLVRHVDYTETKCGSRKRCTVRKDDFLVQISHRNNTLAPEGIGG